MTTNRLNNEVEKIDTNKFKFALVLILCVRFTCPLLGMVPGFSMTFCYIYGLLFVVLDILRPRKLSMSEILCYAFLIMSMVYIIPITYIKNGNLFDKYQFGLFSTVFFYCIYLYQKNIPNERKRILTKAIMLSYVVTMLISLYYSIGESEVIRQVAMGEEQLLEKYPGIGGYDTAYSSVMILILIAWHMFDSDSVMSMKTKRYIRIFSILVLIFIFRSHFMTLMILFGITVFLFIMRRNSVVTIFTIMLSFLLLFNLQNIGDYFVDVSYQSQSEFYREKLKDFGEMLSSGEARGTYSGDSGRGTKLQMSLEIIKENPLFGMYYGKIGDIGGHQEVFDLLASYGLVGTMFVVLFFVFLVKTQMKYFKTQCSKESLTYVYFFFVILSFINTSFFPTILIIPMVFAPMFDSLFENAKQIGVENSENNLD